MKHRGLLLCAALAATAHAQMTSIVFDPVTVNWIPEATRVSPEGVLRVYGAQGRDVGALLTDFVADRKKNYKGPFDYPVVVVNRLSESTCQIPSEGKWPERKIYLSREEDLLVLGEFKGKRQYITFYETERCGELRRVEITGKRWDVQKTNVRIGGNCGKGRGVDACASVQSTDARIYLMRR